MDESISDEDLIRRLLSAPHRDRPALRDAVVARFRPGAPSPRKCAEVLLRECTRRGGPDGLDLGIDVLSRCGDLTAEFARISWHEDGGRWGRTPPHPRHDLADDAWYILLRAIGRSDLDPWGKLTVLAYCALDGPPGVREATVWALGDAGGPRAKRLLGRIAEMDPSRAVREAAAEVLADLEDEV